MIENPALFAIIALSSIELRNKNEMLQKQMEIERKDALIKSLQTEIKDLRAQVDAKDKKVQKLKEEYDAYET